MERILSIIFLEIKKKKFIKSVLLGILLIIPLLILFPMINKNIDSANVILGVIPYIVLANGCFYFNEDFVNKTDRIIFTGIFKKSEIMISKLASLFFISLNYIGFYEVVLILYNLYVKKGISEFINTSSILNNIYVVCIYTFTLGTFILLVSVCTKNSIFAGIITYVFYFNLILVIFEKILKSNCGTILQSIIRNSPFYILNTGFNNLKYTCSKSIIMLISGCIFFKIACAIINRKNI
ncbi:ABC transporter permease [Clostridium botulinum]|uniref:ABC transporter permease n=1 Tax=Clostridium botulinum TaxID=1491 RepID=UPI0006A463AE|nr:ABC transporter permease [Clostridium botulinum]KOC32727.1 hypothetical protein ADU81_10845 [Clostridium botulinum]